MTTIPSITALPTPPQTSDPADFDARADAFLEALNSPFVTEMNASIAAMNTVAGEVSTNATAAAASATSASGSATTATTEAGVATTQADNASTSANASSSSATLAANWAQETGAFVTASLLSAKEWAVGTFKRGVAGFGSAMDWATLTGTTVDNAEYSAKEYAVGTTVAAGSAKTWATAAATSAAALTANANTYRTVDVVDVNAGAVATAYAAGQTIDGVVLAASMRVLRATPGGNAADGIYTAPASGAASRASDSNSATLMPSGIEIAVTRGTALKNSSWVHTTAPGFTLGTTALTFVVEEDAGQPETSIASAMTTDIGALNTLRGTITGTTAITSFGARANVPMRTIRFQGALTLTHNAASLILLGGASRTTAAGDIGEYASDASGNWRELSYTRAASDPGDGATKSSAQTLSNKTIAAPLLTGVVDLTGASGLKFPATQTPSSDPNTIDDYQEVSWTPVVYANSTSTPLTGLTCSGFIRKIGSLAYVSVDAAWTGKGTGSGNIFTLIPSIIAVPSGLNSGQITIPVGVFSGITAVSCLNFTTGAFVFFALNTGTAVNTAGLSASGRATFSGTIITAQ